MAPPGAWADTPALRRRHSPVLLDPLDLVGRLFALVPPPRFHMVRYHGVLAGNAKARPGVVPGREPVADEQLRLFSPAHGGPLDFCAA